MKDKNGAFEQVTRTMVDILQAEVKEGFANVNKRLDAMDERYNEMFNHQSNKVQPWVTWLLTLCGAIIGTLATFIITHF